MKFIRNRSLTKPTFLTMTCSQVTMYFFAFCLFIELKKKENKRKQQQKKKKKKKKRRKLYRAGIEPGISRSPVLHFTNELMHKLRSYTEIKSIKSLLKQWGLPNL